MTDTVILTIQKAWEAALDEFIALNPSGEKSMLNNLTEVIKKIRHRNLLREGKDATFIRDVYNDVRNLQDFYLLVMSMATTFCLELPDYAEAISYFCNRASIYTVNSGIVDQDSIQRKASVETMIKILTDNPWLFMLCVASTQERLSVLRLAHVALRGNKS